PTKLEPFHDYILERMRAAAPEWIAAPALLRELQARGYRGQLRSLQTFMQLNKPVQEPDPVMQVHRLVHAVDPLVVPLWPAPTQELAALPEAPAGVVFDQLGQGGDQLGVAHRPVQGRPIPRRRRQPHALTGPAQGPRVHLDQV